MAASQRDDFDMAKLQKSLKQQRRRSLQLRSTVTKLTPAEIRSLNNSAASARNSGRQLYSKSERANSNTPPLTPENVISERHPSSGRTAGNLPTPPHSPEHGHAQRRSSAANGIPIHSPIPQSYTQAVFMAGNHHSRPSSVSSHRSLPTYRGNELTRTGSLTMLRPTVVTHQIVDNPLSQFSRPRQSRGSGSVSPSRQDERQGKTSEQGDSHSQRSQSVGATNGSASRSISPPDMTESPVAVAERTQDEHTSDEPTEKSSLMRANTVAADGSLAERGSERGSARFSWNWRRHNRYDSDDTEDLAPNRRKTLSRSRSPSKDLPAIAYDHTKPGPIPEYRKSLKGELPSDRKPNKAQEEPNKLEIDTNFSTHPAVRPLSGLDSDAPEAKGKSKQSEAVMTDAHNPVSDESTPVYSRCACCGKLRKPPGNRSLSPVLENENLITNFSFEIERADVLGAGRRRSSSANRQKYVPIIPMMVSDGQTVQAKIGPKPPEVASEEKERNPVINKRGDLITTGIEPIPLPIKKTEEKEKKIVRFSSLNAKKDDERPSELPQVLKEANPANYNVEAAGHAKSDANPSVETSPEEPQTHSQADLKPVPKDQVNINTSSAESQSESNADLMAAMSGIDLTFDNEMPLFDTKSSQNASNNTITARTTHDMVTIDGSRPQSVVGVIAVGSTESEKPLPAVDTPKSQKGTTSPGSGDVVQQPSSTVTVVPKSILKQTSRDSSARSSFDGSSGSSYIRPKIASKRASYSTRPKSTAKFVQGTSPEVPRSTTIPTKANEHTPRTGTSEKMETKSSDFDLLPLPQLGPKFKASNGSLNNYVAQHGRSKSNLVESVLAATKADRRTGFERALSRV